MRYNSVQTGAFMLLICILTQIKHVFSQQQEGSFPPLVNVGENKPTSTAPEYGTCGYNPDTGALQRSAFCRSSALQTSVTRCTFDYCIQDCRSRTSTPSPNILLTPTICVTPDNVNLRPGSDIMQDSYIFRSGSGPDCFVTPVLPVVGDNGKFTLSVWLRPDNTNDGAIIERRTTAGQLIYAITVSSETITFDYRTATGLKFLTVPHGAFIIGQWTHLVIQVFSIKISFFIDGLEIDGTPFYTTDLVGQVVDNNNAETRIGQRLTGANQYVGRMQEMYFFQETLTNREIEELYTGVFQELHLESDCRCPDSHPRVHPLTDRYCLQNGEPDTSSNQQERLNEDAHPLAFANDGDLGSYWVSTFSNDMILYIDLANGQYQVFYVVLQFYSPQPKSLSISRKHNDTSEWTYWQFFADDCVDKFGMPNDGQLNSPTAVNCLQFKTSPPIPYSNANITFQLLAPEPVRRPGYNDFYNTPELLDFVKATQIRIRLQDHYHVTSSRHQYYGIDEVTISARCDCNGHAESCDLEANPYRCNCVATSHTMGDHCDQCTALYNDKPFRSGDQTSAYNCKPCNCNNHAENCVYDVTMDQFPNDHSRGGGGVCVNCQHNTQGRFCDECKDGFFRDPSTPIDSPESCKPCACYADGTIGGNSACEPIGGQCQCKTYITGRNCDTCERGYFNLSPSNPDGCESCGCNTDGTRDGDITCNEGGVCTCKANVIGDKCDRCNYGYHNLNPSNPEGCQSCNCNQFGSASIYCNPSNGICQCKPSVQGEKCNECRDQFYGLGPSGCTPCTCDDRGSEPGSTCDRVNGACTCKAFVLGTQCNQCLPNYYGLQQNNPLGCSPCGCNNAGTIGGASSCDASDGQCQCKSLVTGRSCNQCAVNNWGLDAGKPEGCQPCECDPSGTQMGPDGQVLGCDQNSGQCPCLTSRTGRQCDACSAGTFKPSNGNGCTSCDCHPMGSIGGTSCDSLTGQCECTGGGSGVSGLRCSSCLPEYWNFNPTTGTCSQCDCNPAGSLNTTCETITGQCDCKELVTGRQCDQCKAGSSNLVASNPQGCSKAPSQQPAPIFQVISPYALLISWDTPDQPNGIIQEYKLYRDNVLIFSGITNGNPLSIQLYEDSGLTPYTDYVYYVEATNEAGSVASPILNARTPDAIPSEFNVLTIRNIGSKTADFSWFTPSDINAPVTQYILTSVTPSKPTPPTQHYAGPNLAYRATDLIPFTNYTFRLTVCTTDGCGQGKAELAYTESAPPEGVIPPNATALSPTAMRIKWGHPLQANGIITHYELFIRGLPGPDGTRDPQESRIFYPAGWYNPRPTTSPLEDPAAPPATNFTVEGLDPFTRYEFKVTAMNSAGTTASAWIVGMTMEDFPISLPAPMVTGISSTSLNVSWNEPPDNEIRGFVVSYNLFQVTKSNDPFAPPEMETLLYSGGGNQMSFIVTGLTPYSSHVFLLEACNSVGCIKSGRAVGNTLEAVPTGLIPPFVNGYNSSSMKVTWNSPQQLNGPDPSYQAHRMTAAFSTVPPQVEKGARFPGGGYYLFSNNTLPHSSYTGIELKFRVNRPLSGDPVSSLLLFAASDGEQEEYIVIQLRDGRPWFLFDPQGGAAGVTPNNDGGRTYDDGVWHHVLVTRDGVVGEIVVDGVYTGSAAAPTSNTIIGIKSGLYIGGLPTSFEIRRQDFGNLEIIRKNFMGCLRDIKIEKVHLPIPYWEDLNWDASLVERNVVPNWQGCPINVQEGAHFLGGGYAILPEGTFTGSENFDLRISLRTQYRSGLVLFAYSDSGSYILLQIVDSNLQLTVATSSLNSVTLTTNGITICNGQWYTITVSKRFAQLSLAVEGRTPVTGSLSGVVEITSEIYVGGIPQESDVMEFVDDAGLSMESEFGGCMKDLTYGTTKVDFSHHTVQLANVYLDGCPESDNSCLEASSNMVYNGMEMGFEDTNLELFTEYLYQITAINNAGSTASGWAVGRTRDGPPSGVTPPTDPVSITGYVIQVSWQRPSGNTGLLTHYLLTAYDQDRPGQNVEARFEDTSPAEYKRNITDVIPYTNYAITLTACTSGGCTESGSISVSTIQEAPKGVSPPEATARTATSLVINWAEPDMPNGVITSYKLTMEDLEIYSGVQRRHTESGLGTFTGYRFILTACTTVGCTNSPEVTIVTAQLPPTSMDPPTLLVRGPTSMEAQWTEPMEPNGILERYVLYVSEIPGEAGREVYNTTELFKDFIIADLTAGTLYFASVAACTGGGCTTSPQSSVRTEESVPEGVQAPHVIATSPYDLEVTWDEPMEPNGIIVSYGLIQNGIKVQDSAATSATITDLTPWSLHTFRLEACTSKGCSFGPETRARTQEAAPQGVIALTVFVDDARTVNARWSSPASPNGFMVYEVLFTGLFYVAPESNNFNTITETRTLYNGTDADVFVNIAGLIPNSQYQIWVHGYNTKGSLLSERQIIALPQSSPDGVVPPSLYALSSSSIQAQWQEPGRNNAPGNPSFQLQYRPAGSFGAEQDIFTNPTRVLTYIKSGLVAYTEYEFRLIAINNYGIAESDWASQFTLEDIPGPVDAPMATVRDPQTLLVTWEYPNRPNGVITSIKIYQNDVLRTTVPGNSSNFLADDLTPYSNYYFKVEMCNSVGCTASPNSNVYTTPQAAPSGQPPPNLLSNTPTSIVITWTAPSSPNGPLIGYEIERRRQGTSSVTSVVSVGPSGPFTYMDRSPSIVPYTTYEYRIRVTNPSGASSSLWAEVTTRPAPPGGVQAPTIVTLDYQSVEVIWEPPARSNGEIISYTIHMPDPRIYIGNPNITSYTVDGLVPYTDYLVTIEACTPGGCTESSPTTAQTDPYFPQGQGSPRGDPITQSYISVIWNPPSQPNGPNIRYDLHRMKVAQPLELGVIIGLGFWELIYQGQDTNYQDVGLTTFTTYQYRITVYNDIGPTTSDPSEEVTTLAGIPRQSGSIRAIPLDHISVQLNWTTPTLHELQGLVVAYYIEYLWDSGYVSLEYPLGVEADILYDLVPNTQYEFKQIIYNGAYNITSPVAYAETFDGAPSGFDPPIIYVISPTSVRVAWRAPSQPNGEITEYTLYRDDVRIVSLPRTTLSYVLADLQPYTVYKMQIGVCTVYDCVLSNITYSTTLEAPPSGIAPPNIRILGSHDTEINWAAPQEPNGIIQQYEVLRRSVGLCDKETSDMSDSDIEVCVYVECGITESICGSQCYFGNKVCCDGTLFDYQLGYECCGTNYLPAREDPTDICCGGRFVPFQQNHECCQNQYVQVLPGQICCPDPNENRVAVGFGDKCCGGVPFEDSGPQICCAGAFHDGFNSKCCGSSIIESNQVCCEENGEGAGYEPDPNMQCCGNEYVSPYVTLCCANEAGSAKVHYYNTPEEKSSANEHCCGLQNIGPSQSCCNNIGYNPATHVCADRSTSATGGCGGGMLCPISQAPSAYCNRCDFDQNTHVCGAVEGRHVTANPSPTTNPGDSQGQCRSGLLSVFVGGPNTYNYQDSGLSPFTTYEYTIAVHNSAGSASSDFASARTHEDIPEGVTAPIWEVDQGVLDTIHLTWDQPEYPNGEITTYILRRDGVEIYRGDDKEYDDNNGIQPYQHYTYELGACTTVGCASSPQVVAATLQAAPDNLFDPVVIAADATSLRITWREPGLPNGVIESYEILLTGKEDPVFTTGPGIYSFIHRDLVPYIFYQYAITACTAAGCTTSNPVGATTLQAAPQGVSAPVHVSVSATILEIYWEEPMTPNGIITSYQLYRSGALVFQGDTDVRLFTDTGLAPNSRYEYILGASTIAGSTNSSVYVCQTYENAPEGIPVPTLNVQSANVITASWTPATIPNGVVAQYAVMLQSGSIEQFTRTAGLNTVVTIDGLMPFTYYDVRVQACNNGGCGVGPKAYAQTFEAPPEDQAEPSLVSSGSSVVEVTWEPPTKPNGVITRFYIYRRVHNTLRELLVYLADGESSYFKDAGGLEPFSLYEYRVRAENSRGSVDGPWAEVRTLEAPPRSVPRPTVDAVSPYAANAMWEAPSSPNGVISAYRIEYQQVSNDPTLSHPIIPAASVDGSIQSATFYGLLPYTQYNVRIIAINGAGESPGSWAEVTTQQGVPADIGKFFVEQIPDGQSLYLRWAVPGNPNGEIIEYRIYEDIYLGTPIYVGLNRVFLFRRLDPFTDYVVVLEACTNIGCGRGDPQTVTTAEIAPDDQAPPTFGFVNATVVQLLWRPPVNPNGHIKQYDIIRRTSTLSSRRRRDTDNSPFTETRVIYTEYDTDRDEFDYADYTLHPYQLYEYSIRAVNSRGDVDSEWVEIRTDQAPPIGVLPPVLSHVQGNPTSLNIQWSEPGQNNGVIQGYQLQRNNSAPFSFPVDTELQFTDIGLKAFTIYAYTLTVCSGGGCTTSSPELIRTLETAPGEVPPPAPRAIGSTQIEVTWVSPSLDFGEIIRYELKVDDVIDYAGLSLQHTVSALTPYQEYSFTLVACTAGGCKESLPAYERPHESNPDGMSRPELRALSSTAVEASWNEPIQPNGRIIRYELRRDGKLIYDGSAQRFQDFGDGGRGLTPGQEYSYVVTAFNSQGSAISPPGTVRTSSSSPAGLIPPQLQTLSSTSILSTWQPPRFPNGDIQNYTLYVDTGVVYSGKLFSFEVSNLQYFTTYEFRIEACTASGCALSEQIEASTLEHVPSGQLAPTLTPLSDNTGVATGIAAEWGPPQNANGIILGYELFRRRVFRSTGDRSDPVLLVNGTEKRYTDLDSTLIPDETYEYMVTSMNSVGKAASTWALVRMMEAPPLDVIAPEIAEIEATTLTINILEPGQPNGAVSSHTIIRNGSEIVTIPGTSYKDKDLQPFTYYSYSIKYCTSGGCTTSESRTILTKQDTPTGLLAPVVREIDVTWAFVVWQFPLDSNGIISRFELHMRQGCPATTQPFSQTCSTRSFRIVYDGLQLSHNATGLSPYTKYDFMVKAYNDEGVADSGVTQQDTLATLPEFVSSLKPRVDGNSTAGIYTINWANSFILNGELVEYQLVENGDKVYSGIATVVERRQDAEKYELMVTCRTKTGQVNYPTLIYEADNGKVIRSEPLTQWYSSVWFIAIMALIGVILIFIIIAVFFSRISKKQPYERERQPLPPRQKKGQFNFSGCNYPDSESVLDPIPNHISRTGSMASLHQNAFANPSFLTVPSSRPPSRMMDSPEGKQSLKYIEDDGGFVEKSFVNLPKGDSGMYDDDALTQASIPYSYTKEQTMFTDTHL